jgi:hypothetical protein
MQQPGMIRLCLGFLLLFGAVGGMENPDQADYFVAQIFTALAGLTIMWSGTRAIDRNTTQTINSMKGRL